MDLTHDDRYAEILEGIRTLDLWWVHLAPPYPVGNEGARGRDVTHARTPRGVRGRSHRDRS